ncbi:Ger(x)C family spore germination protein [Psychrobacillus sp. NPDC096389]|uniref:Ger(x)C family spore germination protein n=1 Tax=Psychrobacillus sp. NPDC096389 TaxID=3364490 RepID=UPI0037F595E4
MKKVISILCCVVFLSGCWDERLNKNIAIVPMIGFDGELGSLTGYFGIPGKQQNMSNFNLLMAEGQSVEEVRQKIDTQVNEGVDLSKLGSILISDQLAEKDLYSLLDLYYRNARNRLNAMLIITEGSAEPFIQYGQKISVEVNDYYPMLLEGFTLKSVVPHTDLQLACSILLDEGIDLVLPYLKISSENDVPELVGLALFDSGNFTGEILNIDESIILNVMRDDLNKYAYITYMEEKIPLTISIKKVKRKMHWDGETIGLDYQLKVSIMEYYKNNFKDKNTRLKLEKSLEEKITSQMESNIKILLDANSDALGLGRIARAFHPKLFQEGKWNEIYPTLTITPTVQVKITDTGILD